MADWLINWTLWHWLILGFILLIGEVLTPGIFLLWWGLAALVTALYNFFFQAFPLPHLLFFTRY